MRGDCMAHGPKQTDWPALPSASLVMFAYNHNRSPSHSRSAQVTLAPTAAPPTWCPHPMPWCGRLSHTHLSSTLIQTACGCSHTMNKHMTHSLVRNNFEFYTNTQNSVTACTEVYCMPDYSIYTKGEHVIQNIPCKSNTAPLLTTTLLTHSLPPKCI